MHWCKTEATVNLRKKKKKKSQDRGTHARTDLLSSKRSANCKFYLCVLQIKPKMGIIMAMVRFCHRSNECGQLGDFWHGDVFSTTSRSKYTKTGWREEEESCDLILIILSMLSPSAGASAEWRRHCAGCLTPLMLLFPMTQEPTYNSINASKALFSLSSAPVTFFCYSCSHTTLTGIQSSSVSSATQSYHP